MKNSPGISSQIELRAGERLVLPDEIQKQVGPGSWIVTIRPADHLALYAFKTSGRYLATRESRLGDRAFSVIRPIVHARRAKGA